MLKMGNKRKSVLKTAVAAVIICGALAAMLFLLGSTDQMTQQEQNRALIRALRNAAISCYAIEGRYPDTLEKMVRDYGLVIDTDKYFIYYDVFADNVMPEIFVDVKGESE